MRCTRGKRMTTNVCVQSAVPSGLFPEVPLSFVAIVAYDLYCTECEKRSVESTHKVPTSHTKHCHAAVASLGGQNHRQSAKRSAERSTRT